MNKNNTIEDDIVYALVQKPREQILWQTIYRVYREPFVLFYHKWYQLSVQEGLNLLEQAYADLFLKLENRQIRPPLNSHLFELLLLNANQHLRKNTAIKPQQKNIDWKKALSETGNYHESDILLLLIKQAHKRSFEQVVQTYKKPFVAKLNRFFNNSSEDPTEVYGDTMMAVQKNILNGKPDIPMTSMLFTYCLRVGRFQFSSFHKKNKSKTSGNYDEDILNKIAETPAPTDYTEEKLTLLRSKLSLAEEMDEGAVIAALLDQINEPCKTMLEQRFLKGWRFKQIAKQAGIQEPTARKRVFDCLKKIRRLFN